jgi:hypothetical protein
MAKKDTDAKQQQQKLKSDAKQAALSEALRANLRRRKQQARSRTAEKPAAEKES